MSPRLVDLGQARSRRRAREAAKRLGAKLGCEVGVLARRDGSVKLIAWGAKSKPPRKFESFDVIIRRP